MRALFVALIVFAPEARAAELVVKAVRADLAAADPTASYWESAPAPIELTLMAQPMVAPRPATTTTTSLAVQALHDGQRVAFRLRWKDTEPNQAGRLGELSDAAALQFPVAPKSAPPPVFMGAKGDPVHIFHWRLQYQRDAEVGKPTMQTLYPNMAVDMYPMEFKDPGSVGQTSAAQRETFSPGVAEGNPQSFAKRGVDEILAEGFSTSAVQPDHGSVAKGVWKDGVWTLVIVRSLVSEGGSRLTSGERSFVAAAVWQGGAGEVGSRKCVTMAWTPVVLEALQAQR